MDKNLYAYLREDYKCLYSKTFKALVDAIMNDKNATVSDDGGKYTILFDGTKHSKLGCVFSSAVYNAVEKKLFVTLKSGDKMLFANKSCYCIDDLMYLLKIISD